MITAEATTMVQTQKTSINH